MQYVRSILLFAAALLVGTTAAEAQLELHGRVIDDASGEPVAGAAVTLLNTRGRAMARYVANDSGIFSFTVERPQAMRFRAERVGYRQIVTPAFDPAGYAVFHVEVRMDVAAVLLAPLEVVARSRGSVSPTLAGFEHRRSSGAGWSISREEIAQRNVTRVSDILAMAPGVTINRRIVYMARAGNCPAQIYIDGSHINRPVGQLPGRRSGSITEMFPIDDLVRPSSVEGIEVFQGISRVPAEFLTPEAACGVVAIWTRRS
jgi:hypothetical protein